MDAHMRAQVFRPNTYTTLINEIRSASKATFGEDEDQRATALREAQALVRRLETSHEALQRIAIQEPAYKYCLRVADKISLFEYIKDPPYSSTTADLAAATETDPVFLKRILRHLATSGTISEPEPDRYLATELSRALSTEDGRSALHYTWLTAEPTFMAGPELAPGFANPTDSRNTAFQQAHDCVVEGTTFIEHGQREGNKQALETFNHLTKFSIDSRESWMHICSPGSFLWQSRSSDRVALVDIGCETGDDVIEFHRRYPARPGRVVLQCPPGVIGSVAEQVRSNELNNCEVQAYDFFTPQPVRGAVIYFMGSLLHDCEDDDDVKRILANVAAAMEQDHSTLLLSANVLLEKGCHPYLSGLDLTTMSLFALEERSEGHWKALIESQGLKLIKVHTASSCTKSVLEVELA